MAWKVKVILLLDVLAVAAVAVAFVTLHHHAKQRERTVRTGVVLVDADLGHGTRTEGSGVVLDRNGEVLTNNHVIDGAQVVHVRVPGQPGRYLAHILGYDVAADTALLKLDHPHALRTVVTASGPARVGQGVFAVGGSTGRIAYTRGHVTRVHAAVTAGDELGRRQRLRGLIQFDAKIEPGDSGGPLLDGNGMVLGLNTAGTSRPDFFAARNVAISYAVPIGDVLAVAHAIEEGRASAQVHIGKTALLGLYLGGHGRVDEVVPGSPAAAAGLARGARLRSIDGTAVRSADQLVALLLRKHPGDRVSVAWGDGRGEHRAPVRLVTGPAM